MLRKRRTRLSALVGSALVLGLMMSQSAGAVGPWATGSPSLLTNPGLTITWRNQTDRGWTVIFDHQAVHSETIPAGGTFTWKSPTPISVTYHDGNHAAFTGQITVQGA